MKTTKENQKIETFLPCFEGFYNTIYEFDEENILYSINQDRQNKGLNQISFDSLKINYSQYELDIVKNLCYVITNELKEYVYSIDFQDLIKPKEYNFKNDSVNVVIEPNIKAIQSFIYENKENFSQYLKERYTSYSGFISHYDNDFKSWEKDTDNFQDFSIDCHRLGAILEFIALKLDINENIVYSVKENVSEYEYIENYFELQENPSCVKCENIIEDDNILKMIEKYKKIQGIFPKTCLCEKCLENIQ